MCFSSEVRVLARKAIIYFCGEKRPHSRKCKNVSLYKLYVLSFNVKLFKVHSFVASMVKKNNDLTTIKTYKLSLEQSFNLFFDVYLNHSGF